jgi:hypothetical protein
MDLGPAACREHRAFDSDASILQLLSSLLLAVFVELSPSRLSRLLDAIAENECLHELTMLD